MMKAKNFLVIVFSFLFVLLFVFVTLFMIHVKRTDSIVLKDDLSCQFREKVYTDAIEWIRHDLQVSKDGLAWLKTVVELAKEDYTTFDMLKEYYQDEEDMYWGEQQLELINIIGKKNWILKQM